MDSEEKAEWRKDAERDAERSAAAERATRLVLAVLIGVAAGWWAYGRFADPSTCGYQPNPEDWPRECMVDYTRWAYLMFPNIHYEEKYNFSIQQEGLFDACIAALGSTHDTAIGWSFDVEDGRYGRATNIPENVLDACDEYNSRGVSEADWIVRRVID